MLGQNADGIARQNTRFDMSVKTVGVAVIVAFGLGYLAAALQVSTDTQPTYAINPDGCGLAGKVATGWETSRTFHGGINAGGITANTLYECR